MHLSKGTSSIVSFSHLIGYFSIMASSSDPKELHLIWKNPALMGRYKNVYVLNQKKWYTSKIPTFSLEALKMVGKIHKFEERKGVLRQNRPGLMKLIRLVMNKSSWN